MRSVAVVRGAEDNDALCLQACESDCGYITHDMANLTSGVYTLKTLGADPSDIFFASSPFKHRVNSRDNDHVATVRFNWKHEFAYYEYRECNAANYVSPDMPFKADYGYSIFYLSYRCTLTYNDMGQYTATPDPDLLRNIKERCESLSAGDHRMIGFLSVWALVTFASVGTVCYRRRRKQRDLERDLLRGGSLFTNDGGNEAAPDNDNQDEKRITIV